MSVINRNSGSPIFNTLAEAQASNMNIGQLPIVLGSASAFDGGGIIYSVQPNGSGGIAMTNGNELVQYTGTAAVLDAQADLDDATADRLMKVGAFGLGSDTAANENDMDSTDESQLVITTGSTANTPTSAAGLALNLSRSADVKAQLFFGTQNTDGDLYYRSGNSGFDNWNQVVTSATTPYINVKWTEFGAVGNGVADDTAAIQAAIDSITAGTIMIPAGRYLLTSSLDVENKQISIVGEGVNATILETSGTNNLIVFSKDWSSENGVCSIRDIALVTADIDSQTAIRVEGIDDGASVVGGNDHLYIENVKIDSDSTGYWRRGIYILNTGGVYANNFTIRNDNDSTAQQDPQTRGIEIENTTVATNMIRSFHASNFYVQRTSKAIEMTTDDMPIESCYINNFELVGCKEGFTTEGTSTVGAISMMGGHIDCITNGVALRNDSTNNARIIGCDIRRAENGDVATDGSCIIINTGSDGQKHTISANTLTGNQSTNLGFTQNGVLITGDSKKVTIGDNVIDNVANGISVATDSRLVTIGANQISNATANDITITTSNSGEVQQVAYVP